MSNVNVRPIAITLGATIMGSMLLNTPVNAHDTFHAASLAAPYAFAGTDTKATEGKCGMQCDTDKDGKATKAEVMAAGWTQAQFGAADAGHRGFLTQADFDAYHLLNKSEPVK